MAATPEPSLDDHLWTIAVARLVLGPSTSVQAPPNLRPGVLARLIEAGLDDWGGVSPVTPDHVNPEAPWPHLIELERATESAGKSLAPRLPIHPRYVNDLERWIDPGLRNAVLAASDGQGLGRESGWYAGDAEQAPVRLAASGGPELGRGSGRQAGDTERAPVRSAPGSSQELGRESGREAGDTEQAPVRSTPGSSQELGRGSGREAGDTEQAPVRSTPGSSQELGRESVLQTGDGNRIRVSFAANGIARRVSASLARVLDRVRKRAPLDEAHVVRLFEARGVEARTVCQAADALRHERNGDAVGYVVNRNINYTNVCYFKCRFCAFSKGRLSANLRGRPYDLDPRGDCAPHPRGMGPGRDRGLSARRHPPRLHG